MQPPSAPKFGRRTARAPVRVPGWRSAGIAALLCSTVAWASFPRADDFRSDERTQWNALGVGPAAAGGRTGLAMAPTDAVEPIDVAPERKATPAPADPPQAEPATAAPLRVRGVVGDGFYWSLRASGASPQSAAQYLAALATEIDVGEVGQGAGFDMVFGTAGELLYAGLDRATEPDLKLVRWTAGGRAQWINAANVDQPVATSSGLASPVPGRITSYFGYRVHPIFRFRRFHSGVDFHGSWGSPIVAAADGEVAAAGWAGGYGRQVRLSHGGGVQTSYSHMSQIAVSPGAFVRQGQIIGYVGSSGFSTGPHLHYEVIRGGVKVNPLGVRFAGTPVVDHRFANAVKARLNALLSVGAKRG